MTDLSDNRKIYFGAGPAALPPEVLQQASAAILNYEGSGLSILEIPHRGKLFQNILDESKTLVNELCGLSDAHEIIWLQGGGRMQFTMLPMNFLKECAKAAYIDSGHWSDEAIKSAGFYGSSEIIASSKNNSYNALPPLPARVSDDYNYLHYTSNNTIYGTQWKQIPATDAPLVADMSSDFLSIERDFAAHDLIYAVAQKNIGCAGVTLVIIKKCFLEKQNKNLPPVLDYAAAVKADSTLNTPPVFAIYVSLLMLRWTKGKTLQKLAAINQQKAEKLYAEIDRNPLFYGTVTQPEDRSFMNACFRCHDEKLEPLFLEFSKQQNIEGIKGHRSVGGFRASLYNAVTLPDVQKLVAIMQAFEQQQNR